MVPKELTIGQKLAAEMRRIVGKNNTKIIKVKMKYEDELIDWLKKSEEAYKKTANSKLHFGKEK